MKTDDSLSNLKQISNFFSNIDLDSYIPISYEQRIKLQGDTGIVYLGDNLLYNGNYLLIIADNFPEQWINRITSLCKITRKEFNRFSLSALYNGIYYFFVPVNEKTKCFFDLLS